jgi:hypothetical protein
MLNYFTAITRNDLSDEQPRDRSPPDTLANGRKIAQTD